MRYIQVMQISMQYGSLHKHYISHDDNADGDDRDDDDEEEVEVEEQGDEEQEKKEEDEDNEEEEEEKHLSQWSAHHLSQVPPENFKEKSQIIKSSFVFV